MLGRDVTKVRRGYGLIHEMAQDQDCVVGYCLLVYQVVAACSVLLHGSGRMRSHLPVNIAQTDIHNV